MLSLFIKYINIQQCIYFALFLFFNVEYAKTQTAHLIIPQGHLESINSVSCSFDGKYILSGSKDLTVILWDAMGLELKTLKFPAEVKSVAISKDNQFIYTACSNGNITIWKLNGEVVQSIYAHKKPLTCMAISEDGNLILSGSSDKTVKLWNSKGKLIQTFKHDNSINSVSFSKDGKSIISACNGHSAFLWNVNGKLIQTFSGHKASVLKAELSPDGLSVLTASADSSVILWNLNGNIIRQMKHRDKVISCAFSSDSSTIASGSYDGEIKIWNYSGETISHFNTKEEGLTTMCFNHDGSELLTGNVNKSLNLWNINGQLIRHFQGHSHDVHSACFSPDGNFILISSGDHSAKLWDVLNYSYRNFPSHSSSVISSEFSNDGKYIVTGSEDKSVKLWDIKGKLLKTLVHSEKIHTAKFAPNDKLILTACDKNIIKLWDLTGKEILSMNNHGKIVSAVFSLDGKSFYITTHDSSVSHYNLSGKLIKKIILHLPVNDMVLSGDEKTFVTANVNGHVQIWDIETGNSSKILGTDSNEIICISNSIDGKFIVAGYKEGGIELFNLTDKTSKILIGHSAQVNSVNFSPDSKFIISSSADETTRLWSVETAAEKAKLISIDDKDWVVTTPNGLFDASPGAMELMNYEVGFETVELEQLKERYYEPGILEEIFGDIETEYHESPSLKNIALYPELEGKLNKDELIIKLKPRSGGIGKLVVFVNNKEVEEDANQKRKTELKIDLNTYTRFYDLDTNVITLRVYNEDGWLESQAYNYYYFPYQGSKGSENPGGQKNAAAFKGKPHLYALVVGTSDYSGDKLDLKYPDLDATAIAQGLHAVGSRLFEDRVHIRLLTTHGKIIQDLSSRTNIENVLKDYATKAKPGDIVITYFSGHGTTYGQAEKNQFYYLTKDIASENLSDPEIRNNFTISSDDLTKWLTAIPAHKEVLIFDACHSGRAVETLSGLGAKDLSPSQIRALDRMKDRSGIFIISGSAADAVSYEASAYGQGLLTYSLLEGMSGLAVTEDKRVDLAQLFEYARDKVPEYAKSINKIQIPVVAFPKGGGSFDVGIVDSTVKIKLAQPKPIFIRNIFLDESSMSDHLNLTHTLAEYFRNITSSGLDASLIYVDVNEYENAYSIKGLYAVKGNSITLRARLFRGNESINEFQLTGSKSNSAILIENIVEKVTSLIQK